ncbi:MAG: DUF3987 domain-containing protein [Candidatus Babeliaceae bacterium]|nr:DUF3987 domain-containing protein [Candidatus Babeliaceae bacterium]
MIQFAIQLIVTLSVLTTVAAFLEKQVFILEGEYYQTLYPNIWSIVIADSGQFKTTALRKGYALALKRYKDVTKAVQELQAQLKDAPDDHKKEIAAEVASIKIKNVLLPSKITTEGLLEHLAQGYNGAIFLSEFGPWLQNMEKTHNNDLKGIMTELYDVPDLFQYKTKTQGNYSIIKPCISVCGVSTLSWIKENIKPNDVASGFFARFLIFTPSHKDAKPQALPSKSPITNSHQEQAIKDRLEAIGTKSYTISEKASELFSNLHNKIIEMPGQYGEHSKEILDPYVKRWSPYLLKLAMIMQVFEDPNAHEISEQAIIQAYWVLLPAINSTIQLFEGELGESDHQRKCRLVFNWICKKVETAGEHITWGQLSASRVLGGGTKDYEYIIKTLIETGKIEHAPSQTRKRKDDRYWPVKD